MSYIDYDGDGELHVTRIQEARTMEKSDIDRVITVCQDSIEDNVSSEMTYSFYCMSDGRPEVEEQYGGSCEYELFEEAADELYEALAGGESVLIHCHAGRSRSVSVAVAVLGRLLSLSRSEAMRLVHRYRIPHSYPDKLLMQHATDYISEHTEHDTSFEGYKK